MKYSDILQRWSANVVIQPTGDIYPQTFPVLDCSKLNVGGGGYMAIAFRPLDASPIVTSRVLTTLGIGNYTSGVVYRIGMSATTNVYYCTIRDTGTTVSYLKSDITTWAIDEPMTMVWLWYTRKGKHVSALYINGEEHEVDYDITHLPDLGTSANIIDIDMDRHLMDFCAISSDPITRSEARTLSSALSQRSKQ